ncbi:MAG: ATP-binding protein [Bryobacteraceae bacterium]|jgi:signal transduction histidine kinase
MKTQQITHQNILRVLISGFALVILLLVAAAVVGAYNIQSIQENAANLVRDQSVTNGLIDELNKQQTSLSDVFSIMARDPDSLDYIQILKQLDEADRDIDRISAEGAETPDRDLWARLKRSSMQFSQEARRILAEDEPETFAPAELFRDHEAFISVVARLVEAEYRKVNAAQGQIDRRSSRLLGLTVTFAGASVLLALVFAAITVKMALQLIRRLEWQTAELSRVSFHMLEDQEATARRFSHELHDELGQQLTAIRTNLTALDSNGEINRSRLEDNLHLVDEAIGNVRQMSQLLRPIILDDFGLEAGLRWLAEGFSTRTGIEVSVDSNHPGRLPDETETHLFRIAQEALTNVARHSGAKRVLIKLDAGKSGATAKPLANAPPTGPLSDRSHDRKGVDAKPEPGLNTATGQVCLTVQDDGRGLDADGSSGRGMGMIGMRARARSSGGDVDVRPAPGGGVLIEVRVPLHNETHSHPVG